MTTVQWVRNPTHGKTHAVTGPGQVGACGQAMDVTESSDSPDRCARCVAKVGAR